MLRTSSPMPPSSLTVMEECLSTARHTTLMGPSYSFALNSNWDTLLWDETVERGL